MNNVPEIKVPRYRKAKWMYGSNHENIRRAADCLLTAFNWGTTKEGADFWQDLYTKLYIMAEHAKIYATLGKLGGEDHP